MISSSRAELLYVRLRSGVLTLAVTLIGLLSACSDESSAPLRPSMPHIVRGSGILEVGRDGALAPLQEMRDIIPAVRIDLPAVPRAFDGGDQQLIDAVRAVNGRVSIGFKPMAAPRTQVTGIIPAITKAEALEGRAAIIAHGARIERTYVNSSTVIAVIQPELAPVLRGLALVNYLEPVAVLKIAHSWPAQDTSWGARKVRAPAAWAFNLGQYSWITILDTGVDSDHLVGEGGDGPAKMSVSDCLYTARSEITSCYDDHGHGSHVAGIAASRNNQYGWIGVAYYPQGVASVKVCDALGRCWDDSVAGGLDWTVSNGRARQVVSMSLGFPQSTTILAEYVARSNDAGNLLVAAAGNDSDAALVLYPARYSQVIAVSGTLPDDSFAGWITCPNERTPYATRSNFGAEVEISAPFYAKSMWLHMDYETHCGTSMATPVVSAVAALIWTKYTTWSNWDVRTRLRNSAIDLGAAGRDDYFGYGRVDALSALKFLSVVIVGPSLITAEGTYTWEAMPDGGDGPYSYRWEFRPSGDPTWYLVGSNSKTYSTFVSANDAPSFELRVTTTSSDNQSASDTHWVTVDLGGACNPC